ncbi:MAG: hypothetical protein P8X94_01230 [Woeseiaceae bacterium]
MESGNDLSLKEEFPPMYLSTSIGTIEIPNVDPRQPLPDEMISLALDTLRTMPLNGLRYLPAEGGSGWYVWGGDEMSEAADFFTPIQVRYVTDYVPNIRPYLALPPGFRFQTDQRAHQKAEIKSL